MFCFPKCLQSKMNQHYLRSCASHSFLLVFFFFSSHAYLILITSFITFSALHPKSPWSQQQCSLIRLNGVMCQVVYLYTLQRKTIYSLVQVHKKNHLENPNRNLSHLIRKHLFTKLKFRCALNKKNKKIRQFYSETTLVSSQSSCVRRLFLSSRGLSNSCQIPVINGVRPFYHSS